MKYIIDLTEKQKAQMDCMMEIVHRYVGFNPKLKMDIPMPIKESPAYQKGFEDGTKWAIDENAKDHQGYYDKGYKQGIADYRKFEKFFHSDGIEMFEDIRNTDGTLSLETILLYLPMSEIMARIKAYEEKKKAEEEIKVGDEVIIFGNDKAVVTRINPNHCDVIYFHGMTGEPNKLDCKKTGRHFDEVSQLLDKLKGEK